MSDEQPVKVSLSDLVKASKSPKPTPEAQQSAVEALIKSRPKTPAGLPKGFQWLHHDTGKLGYAAARRLRQMERDKAKREKKSLTVHPINVVKREANALSNLQAEDHRTPGEQESILPDLPTSERRVESSQT